MRGILVRISRARAKRDPMVEDAVKMTIRGDQLVIKGILDARKIEEALLKIANQEWPRLFIVYKLVLQETWFRKVVAT